MDITGEAMRSIIRVDADEAIEAKLDIGRFASHFRRLLAAQIARFLPASFAARENDRRQLILEFLVRLRRPDAFLLRALVKRPHEDPYPATGQSTMANEPNATQGSPSWLQHSSKDPAAARKFYEAVLGRSVSEMPMKDGSNYPAIVSGGAPSAA